MHLDHRTFTTPTSKKIEVSLISSNFHIECNAADAGSYDRFVIQEVIKEMASSHPLNSSEKGRMFKGLLRDCVVVF
jgi:replication factor C subunit 3/5